MAVLANPKHERFAQLLAKGMKQHEAYEEAGFKPSEPHASRLASSGKVQARVAEILERAAIRAEITVASITEKLLAIAEKAETKDEAAMLGVARASYMDAAKLNGLVIDRSKADVTVTHEDALDALR